jgi:hypothetical protein
MTIGHIVDCLTVLYVDGDENVMQYTCQLKCLDDTYEEYPSYDVITLNKDQELQFWAISGISKIMVGEGNGSHSFLPIFGSAPILPETIKFANKHDFEAGQVSAGEFELSPDFALEVCKEVKSNWNILPKEVQEYYLHAVEERYDRDGKKILVDLFSIELN